MRRWFRLEHASLACVAAIAFSLGASAQPSAGPPPTPPTAPPALPPVAPRPKPKPPAPPPPSASASDQEEVQFGPPLPPVADAEAPAGDAAAAPPPSATAPPAPSASVPAPTTSAPTPAPSASAESGEVRAQDNLVFTIKVGHAGKTARQRAEAATLALKEVVGSAQPDDVHIDSRGDLAVIFVGTTPIVQLYPEDAAAAGDASLGDHAAGVASHVRDAIRREQKRSAIASTVFSIALVVLAALAALYLLRKIAQFAERARTWIDENPERVPRLSIYSMEVLRPAALRSMLAVGLGAGRWLLQFAVVYTWLVFTLSRFEVTRGVNEKLTGLVITPVSALMGRIASSVPLLIVAAIAGVALWVLLRFVGMFFASIARGETKIGWLPTELAAPTSLLLRIAIVIAALVFAAPVVTGDPEGALARGGAVVLIALGLASTPLLTSVIVGATVIYARRLKPGSWTEIGGRTGRVRSIGLLSVELEESDGGELSIPHLLCLVKPTRLLHSAPKIGIVITVAPTEKPATVSDVLVTAASRIGTKPEVDVLRADADGIDFRVTVSTQTPGAGHELQLAVIEAIQESKVRLGRGRNGQA